LCSAGPLTRLLTVGVALAVSGCGGGDSGPSASEVCTERAKVECAKIAECSQGYAIQRSYGTMANCQADQKLTCMESVERTGSGNTPSYAATCTAAIKAQTCADRAAGVAIMACATSKGEFKDGTKCISSNQCASSYCKIPTGMDCGACATRKPEGMDCTASGECVMGLYCQRAAGALPNTMGKCAKRSAAGGPCNAVFLCDTMLSCVGFSASMGLDGVCTARAQKVNDPCNNSDKLCASGLQCVGFSASMMTEGKCMPLGAKEGDACDRQGRVAPNCDGTIGLYCNQPYNMTNMTTGAPQYEVGSMGVCKQRVFAKTGQPCGQAMNGDDPACDSGGTCQRPLREATVNMMTVMVPDTNKQGVCVARVGVGMACNTDGNIGPGCGPGQACVRTNIMSTTDTSGKCVKRDYEMTCMVAKK
jgi:hypothetical protein